MNLGGGIRQMGFSVFLHTVPSESGSIAACVKSIVDCLYKLEFHKHPCTCGGTGSINAEKLYKITERFKMFLFADMIKMFFWSMNGAIAHL